MTFRIGRALTALVLFPLAVLFVIWLCAELSGFRMVNRALATAAPLSPGGVCRTAAEIMVEQRSRGAQILVVEPGPRMDRLVTFFVAHGVAFPAAPDKLIVAYVGRSFRTSAIIRGVACSHIMTTGGRVLDMIDTINDVSRKSI